MNRRANGCTTLMNKQAAGEVVLATNTSYWQWEYDENERTATIFVDIHDRLGLLIREKHTKSGLGAGVRESRLEDTWVGTLDKPNYSEIRSLLAKHSHQRSRAGGPFKAEWTTTSKEKMPLKAIIERVKAMRSEALAEEQIPFPSDALAKAARAIWDLHALVVDNPALKNNPDVMGYLSAMVEGQRGLFQLQKRLSKQGSVDSLELNWGAPLRKQAEVTNLGVLLKGHEAEARKEREKDLLHFLLGELEILRLRAAKTGATVKFSHTLVDAVNAVASGTVQIKASASRFPTDKSIIFYFSLNYGMRLEKTRVPDTFNWRVKF